MLTFVLLISHTISDFILQSNKDVEDKPKIVSKRYLNHGIGLLLTSIPVLVLVNISNWFEVISAIAFIIPVHLLLDYIKERINNKIKRYENTPFLNALIFVIDQMIHILLIVFVTNDISLEYSSFNDYILKTLFYNNGINNHDLKIIFEILYISLSGSFLIPLILDCIYMRVENYSEKLNNILKKGIEDDEEHAFVYEVKAGRWIGILERILIVIFLNMNQIASIGFIIAVKSLARFKMLESKTFSEYYLLGTLLSVGYTLIVYVILERFILVL